jgi:molybdenum cofactor cytidylyltransferase
MFREAFDIRRGDIIAITGAGGKTSLMLAIARELAEAGWRVLATTTTRISAGELRQFPAALSHDSDPADMAAQLDRRHLLFVYKAIDLLLDKVYGVPPVWPSWARAGLQADAILIEADGARGKLLKAPREGEPVVPPDATLVIHSASVRSLYHALDDDIVFNAGTFLDVLGYQPPMLGYRQLGAAFSHPLLGMKGVPDQARTAGWLNDVRPGDGIALENACDIARAALSEQRLHRLVAGHANYRMPEPPAVVETRPQVSAVVLAGGLSTRMGQPKMLLDWGGKPVIVHIVEQLKRAGIADVVVVTGHAAAAVSEAVASTGARTAFNPNYADGEMLSSLKTGLRALPGWCAATLVALGDMPRLHYATPQRLIDAYSADPHPVVAPGYQNKRGHPLLIDRSVWRDLLTLPADASPRVVINAYANQTAWIEGDETVLRDIDTPDDYDDARRSAGLL